MIKAGDILVDTYWDRHYLVLRVDNKKMKLQNMATGEVSEQFLMSRNVFLRKVG